MYLTGIKRFYRGKTGNLSIQAMRYFVAGGIAFAVDFALLWLLTDYFHLYYRTSSVISFSVGLVITYLLSIFWIFDKRRFENRNIEFLIFAVIGVVGLLLTYFFIKIFTEHLFQFFNHAYLFSKILTTVIVFFWNFTAKRITLFSTKKIDK